MEVQDKIRAQFSVSQLKENLDNAITSINEIIENNNYVLTINGEEYTHIVNLNPNFEDLSKNARKNLAKRLHFFNKKKSLRTMNILFLVARKLGVIDEKIYISISKKEKEIQRLGRIYKIMRAKTEEARLAYKKEKGNFYKKNLEI